ncbi:hypothetical protein FHG87_010741 [Trinorchestia longiramus]|nr:hypothetical protein FHG87_010741 [Trinorchestia longiramus]
MGCAPSAIADGEEGEENMQSAEAVEESTRKQSSERIRSSSFGNSSANITSPTSRNGSAKQVPLLNNVLEHRSSLGPDETLSGRRSVGSLKGSAGSSRSGKTEHRLSSDNGVSIPGSVIQTDYFHDLNQQPLNAIEQEMSVTNAMGKPLSSQVLSIKSLVSSPIHNPATENHDGENGESLENIEQVTSVNPPALLNYVVENKSFQRNSQTSSEHDVSQLSHYEQDFNKPNQAEENIGENSLTSNINQVSLNQEIIDIENENVHSIERNSGSPENTTIAEEKEFSVENKNFPSMPSSDLSGMGDPSLTQPTTVRKESLRGSLEESPKQGKILENNFIVINPEITDNQVKNHEQTMDDFEFVTEATKISPLVNGSQLFPNDSTLEASNEALQEERLDVSRADASLQELNNTPPLSPQTESHESNYDHSSPRETTNNLNTDLLGSNEEANVTQETEGHSGGLVDITQETEGQSGGLENITQETEGHSGGLVDITQETEGHSGGLVDITQETEGHSGGLVDITQETEGHSGGLVDITQEAEGHSGSRVDITQEAEGQSRGPTDITQESEGHSAGPAEAENYPNGAELSPNPKASNRNESADAADIFRAEVADDSPLMVQRQLSFSLDMTTSAPAAEPAALLRASRTPQKYTHDEPLEATHTSVLNDSNDAQRNINFAPSPNPGTEETSSSTYNSQPCDQQESVYMSKASLSDTSISKHRPMSSAAVSISDLLSDCDEMDVSLSTSAAALLAFPNRSSTAKYRRNHALDRGYSDNISLHDGKSPLDLMQGEREITSEADHGIKAEYGNHDTGHVPDHTANDRKEEAGDENEAVDNEEMTTDLEKYVAVDEHDLANKRHVYETSAAEGKELQECSRNLSPDSGLHYQTSHETESFGTQGTETGVGPSQENISTITNGVSSHAHISDFDEENEEIEIAAAKGIESRNYESSKAIDPQIAEKHFSDMLGPDEEVFTRLPSMQAVNDYFVKQKEKNDEPDFKIQEGAAAVDFFPPNSGESNPYDLGVPLGGSEFGAPHSLEDDTTDPALYLAHDDSLPSSMEAHYPCSKIDLVSETSDSFSGEEGLFPHEDLRTDIDFETCHETIFEQYTDEEAEASSSKWLFKLNFDSNTEPSVREPSNEASTQDSPPKNTTELLGREGQSVKDEAEAAPKDQFVSGRTILADTYLHVPCTNSKIKESNSKPNLGDALTSFNENASDDQPLQSLVKNLTEEKHHQGNVQNLNESHKLDGLGSSEIYQVTDDIHKVTIEASDLRDLQNENLEISASVDQNELNGSNNIDPSGEDNSQPSDTSSCKNIPHKEKFDSNGQTLKTSFPTQADEDDYILAEQKTKKNLKTSALITSTYMYPGNSTHEVETVVFSKLPNSNEVLNSAERFVSTEATNFVEGLEPTRTAQATEDDTFNESSGPVSTLKFAEVHELNEVEESMGDGNPGLVPEKVWVHESNKKPNSYDFPSLNLEPNAVPTPTGAQDSKNIQNLNETHELVLAQELYEVFGLAEDLESSTASFTTVKELVKPQEARPAREPDKTGRFDENQPVEITTLKEEIHTGAQDPKNTQNLNETHELVLAQELYEVLGLVEDLESSTTSFITVKELVKPQEARPAREPNKTGCFDENQRVETTTLKEEILPKSQFSYANEFYSSNPQAEENHHDLVSSADGKEAQKNSDNGGGHDEILHVNPSDETSDNNTVNTKAPDTLLPTDSSLDPCCETLDETAAPAAAHEHLCFNEDDLQSDVIENSLSEYIEGNMDQLCGDPSDPTVINDDVTDLPFQSEISSPILAVGKDLIRQAASESDRVSIKNQINSLIAQEYKSRSNSPVADLSRSRSNSPTIYFQNSLSNSSAANFSNPRSNRPPKRISKALSNSSISRFPGSRSNSPVISYISNSSASRLYNSNSRHSSPTLLLQKSDSVMHTPLGSVS